MTTEKPVSVYFDFDRETPNTNRFKEDASENPMISGSFYLQKWICSKLGNPKRIKITVEKVS